MLYTVEPLLIWAGIVAAVLIVAVILAAARGSKSVKSRLLSLAASYGWQNVQSPIFRNRVEGTWQATAVAMSHHARYKSQPERLTTKVKAPASQRVIIKRRFKTWWSRPLTWFGPPLVETPEGAADLWIRADEGASVSRIFADPSIAAAIRENLVERFDEITIDRKGLAITRALDEKLMRQRFGRSVWSWGFHEPTLMAVAGEEWRLAAALLPVIRSAV